MRKREISVLNVFYCLVVIFIHCISSAVVSLPTGSITHIIVYTASRMSSFVVQGFIFLSAMKHFLKKDTVSYGQFLISKLKAIIIPYAIWCLIYYFFYSAINKSQPGIVPLVKGIFLGTICYHLYYIVILMQFFLLMPLWKKIFTRKNALIAIPVVTLISSICTNSLPGIVNVFFPNVRFIYNDRIFTTYIVYWTLGCYAGLFYNEFTNAIKKSKTTICIMFAFISFINVYLSYTATQGIHGITSLGSIHILYCICAIIFTYMLALYAKDCRVANNSLIRLINKSSYSIYLSHCMFLSVTDALIVNTLNPQPVTATIIRLAAVYTASLVSCTIYSIIKSRYKSKKQL